MKLKLGFTLSEVLITLGIIGVVAAMAIPTLISGMSKRIIEAQLKENYASIAQAMRSAEGDGLASFSVVANNTVNMKKWIDEFLAPYMKIDQICLQTPGCWHKYGVVKTLNHQAPAFETQVGTDESTIGWSTVTFRTAKGAYYNLDASGKGNSVGLFGIDTEGSTLQFYFDVNGDKGPNVIGKDIMIMIYDRNLGFVPSGYSRTPAQIKQNCESGNGYWCLAYIKSNGWVIPDSVWKR